MEKDGIIKIERRFKRKDYKKVLNFIQLRENWETCDTTSTFKLTKKQTELFEFLKTKNKAVALKDISTKFSYSIVKKLEEKKIAKIFKMKVQQDFFRDIKKLPVIDFQLTSEQSQVLKEIEENISKGKFQTFLLQGVTASGKTEIYIRSMKKVLAKGQTAILLIPEIALTPQTVERFYSHFGEDIAVMHSKQSDRERYYYWKEIQENKKKIVIGPRSVVFAPLSNIGLIIVDEEHENSYKQTGQNPLYNGRDMAVLRGKMNDATVVLGSATPDLESYFNVEKKKYELLEMKKK